MKNNEICEIIKSEGLRETGFCAFGTVKEHLLECRAKQRIPENAKSIILILFPYKVKHRKPENVSRYATVPDYHRVTEKYLEKIILRLKKKFSENKFEPFCDNSPVPEVYAAAAAGLGVIGENGLLINKKYGSWCFIAEIITDLEIDCKNSPKKCSMCGICKKACPRGVHGVKCLSAVSQQKNGLTDEEIKALSDNKIIWGCDLCSENCPLNKNAELTDIKEFINGYRNSYVQGEDISGRAYEWRGEKTVQRNYKINNPI